MNYQWIGAVLIIVGCGGFGSAIAAAYRQEEKLLHQLMSTITYMETELQYQLTPLPELCLKAGKHTRGLLNQLFCEMAKNLEQQTAADVSGCMNNAIQKTGEIPVRLKKLLRELGNCLGQFDLSGQLRGLQEIYVLCEAEGKRLEKGRDQRLRSYKTLGICAGLALIILFV